MTQKIIVPQILEARFLDVVKWDSLQGKFPPKWEWKLWPVYGIAKRYKNQPEGKDRKGAPRHEVLSELDKGIIFRAIVRDPLIRPTDLKRLIQSNVSMTISDSPKLKDIPTTTRQSKEFNWLVQGPEDPLSCKKSGKRPFFVEKRRPLEQLFSKLVCNSHVSLKGRWQL